MPKFFGSWIDKAMPSSVFIPTQIKSYTLGELQASPWYLECARNYAPAQEEDEKRVVPVAAGAPSLQKADDDDDDAVVEIPEPSFADKKRGKDKGVRSPAADGSTRKTKAKIVDIQTRAPPFQTENAHGDRSHCQPLVTSATFSPSQIQA